MTDPMENMSASGADRHPAPQVGADRRQALVVVPCRPLQPTLEFFTTGLQPDGDFVGSGMGHVVRKGTALLPESDRLAIIAWLRSVPGAG